MTRKHVGSAMSALTAVGFLATAALHSTGYAGVAEVAAQGPADMEELMPALWLMFSFDLVVLGLIVGVVALRPIGWSWLIVALAALCPLGAAVLQLLFIGFIPPTAILISVGALAIVSAIVVRSSSRPVPGGDDG